MTSRRSWSSASGVRPLSSATRSVRWWRGGSRSAGPTWSGPAFLEDPPLYLNDRAEFDASPTAEISGQLRAVVVAMRGEGLSADEFGDRVRDFPIGPDTPITLKDVSTDDNLASWGYGLHSMDLGVLDGVIDFSTFADVDTSMRVCVPVFLLAADDDLGAMFSSRWQERLARTHPDVEVARVAGAGHAIHGERHHRATYLEHLRRFLAEHAPAA